MDPGLALHKALLAELKSSLDVDVYDAVPQGAAFPYVTIDTSISSNDDALVERREVRFVFLNVWSQQPGQEQILSIMQDIDEALHDNRLELDRGYIASITVDRKTTRRDADNITFQGQVTLRVVTHH